MSTMERILRLMGEKKASDVYLSATAPALIKINGECVPINNQLLPPDAPRNLLAEIVPPTRIEATPSSHPLMTWPTPRVNSNGLLRSTELSNLVPSSR